MDKKVFLVPIQQLACLFRPEFFWSVYRLLVELEITRPVEVSIFGSSGADGVKLFLRHRVFPSEYRTGRKRGLALKLAGVLRQADWWCHAGVDYCLSSVNLTLSSKRLGPTCTAVNITNSRSSFEAARRVFALQIEK